MAKCLRASKTALVVMLSVVAASACADDHVLSPASAPIPSDAARAELEAAYDLVPGAPVHTEWTEYTTVPDSSWILVEISGTITYSRNPYCFMPGVKGHCDGPPTPIETGGPWGPLQEGAQAGYTIQYGSQSAPNSPGAGDRLFSPTGNPASETGRRLFYNGVGPGRLWARRVVHQTYAGSTTSGVYWPVFVHSGGQVVKVTVVPTPLRVDGPATVPPGEPGTWTAGIVGDFRHRADNGAVPAVQWEFFPGDTFAAHNRFAPRETVRESVCHALECTYTPYKSGRMVASTYVEGQYVAVASQVFRLQDRELELTCGAQSGNRVDLELTRGTNFDCSVNVQPAQSFTVVDWVFRGASREIPHPDSAQFTGWRWVGRMVVSGQVTVRAVVGQDTLAAAANVTVNPRPWKDHIGQPEIRYFSCPGPLTAECPLPDVPIYYHDLGRTDPGPTSWPSQTRHLDGGPNTGFRFIDGDESFLNISAPWIELNGVLRNSEHPFWRERPDCNVAEVHANVLEHEMIHFEGIKLMVEAGVTPGWLESFTPYGTQAETRMAMTERLRLFQDMLTIAGDAGHTSPRFSNPNCDVKLLGTKRNPPVPGRARN